MDFSNLNTHKKTLQNILEKKRNGEESSDAGESSVTFAAIHEYAKRFRPKTIILENIVGAPWERIRKYFDFIGYASRHYKADTKNYLLPQTRQRGYLICIDRELFKSTGKLIKSVAQAKVEGWAGLMEKLKMPLRCSVEDFLLDPDHPALQRAMQMLSIDDESSFQIKKPTNWEVCEVRHISERKRLALGKAVPYTGWARAKLEPPIYANREWIHDQSDRVKDCLDMTMLTHAMKGDDFEYKVHIPNVSQNIDRHLESSRLGVIGCLTPNGLPFLSTRGGPLHGLEALALQGLPVNRIVLAGETHKQLKDLAGNAMSTTVIAAALIAALIVAGTEFSGSRGVELNDRDENEQARQVRELEMRTTRLSAKSDCQYSMPKLVELANSSKSVCWCERGSPKELPPLLVCIECLVQMCSGCSGNPRHFLPLYSSDAQRDNPIEFKSMIGNALPPNLMLSLSPGSFEQAVRREADADRTTYDSFVTIVKEALGQVLYFKDINHASYWIITYESSGQVLQLIFRPNSVEWLLFIKFDRNRTTNSELCSWLCHPVGRCTVRTGALGALLDGQWEVRVPRRIRLPALITGVGYLMPSWRSRLGLAHRKYKNERVWSKINLRFRGRSKNDMVSLLEGTYKALPFCGTANGSLHKKEMHSRTDNGRQAVFLFLDPARTGPPESDVFVIANDHIRLSSGEYRGELAQIVRCALTDKALDIKRGGSKRTKEGSTQRVLKSAQIKHGEKPMHCKQYKGAPELAPSQWRPSNLKEQPVDVIVLGHWHPCEGRLQASTMYTTAELPLRGVSKTCFWTEPQDSCQSALNIIFRKQIPWDGPNPDGRRSHHACSITERNQIGMAMNLTWLMKLLDPVLKDAAKWMLMKLSAPPEGCSTCAPSRPQIKWRTIPPKRGKGPNRLAPFEDPRQASSYESQIRDRPVPFAIELSPISADGMKEIAIAVNAQALVHRATTRLLTSPVDIYKGHIRVSWRLLTGCSTSAYQKFPVFTIGSNESDGRRSFSFPGTNYRLRPEQERSLQWMRARDCENSFAFQEVIVEESTSKHLDWRLEARALRDCFVRGGIAADDVGYGKTITMLALIRDTLEEAQNDLKVPTSLIPAKATLIIVPSLLLNQWEGEIKKFWPDCMIVKVSRPQQLMQQNVRAILQADIVLVSSSFLRHDRTPKYKNRCAIMAGLPPPPSFKSLREYSTWCGEATKRTALNVEHMKTTSSFQGYSDRLRNQIANFNDDSALYYVEPSKRLTGRQFVANRKRKGKQDREGKPSLDFRDQSIGRLGGFDDLDDIKDFLDVKFPTLGLFRFHRKIIDEQSYLGDYDTLSIRCIASLSTWLLSGTPKIRDFADVQRLASVIGVYLGSLDSSEQYTDKRNAKEMKKSRTRVEEFEAANAMHSPAWHQHRHIAAQNFLNTYARKNTALGFTIASSINAEPVVMSSLHMALYTELQSQLRLVTTERSRVIADGRTDHDRNRRLTSALTKAESHHQILIEAAFSHQRSTRLVTTPGSSCNAPTPSLASVIQDREADCASLTETMLQKLRKANDYRVWNASLIASSSPATKAKILQSTWHSVYKRCDAIFRPDADKYCGDLCALEVFQGLKKRILTDAPQCTVLSLAIGSMQDQYQATEIRRARDRAALQAICAFNDRTIGNKDAVRNGRLTDTGEHIRDFIQHSALLNGSEMIKETRRAHDDAALQAICALSDRTSGNRGAGRIHSLTDSGEHIRNFDQHSALADESEMVKEVLQSILRLTKSLIGAIRAVRFLKALQTTITMAMTSGVFPEASDPRLGLHCQHTITETAKLAINQQCGHVSCSDCLAVQRKEDRCSAFCNAATIATNYVIGPKIGNVVHRTDSPKTGSIVERIRKLEKNEQVLLFCQFKKMAEALQFAVEEAGISCRYVKDPDRHTSVMTVFRTVPCTEKGGIRVLIVDPLSPAAAGHNLTNVHIVMFATPVLAGNEEASKAAYVQAIGRAMRFGQAQKVQIIHYVALDTVEVEIFEGRHGLKVGGKLAELISGP